MRNMEQGVAWGESWKKCGATFSDRTWVELGWPTLRCKQHSSVPGSNPHSDWNLHCSQHRWCRMCRERAGRIWTDWSGRIRNRILPTDMRAKVLPATWPELGRIRGRPRVRVGEQREECVDLGAPFWSVEGPRAPSLLLLRGPRPPWLPRMMSWVSQSHNAKSFEHFERRVSEARQARTSHKFRYWSRVSRVEC